MALIYSASQLKLLRPGAKRNPLDAYHYDIHPRIHNLDDMLDKIYIELTAIDAKIGAIDVDIEELKEYPQDTVTILPGISEVRTAVDYEIWRSVSLIYILDKLNIAENECMYIQLSVVIEPNSHTDVDNNIAMQIELENSSEVLKTVEFLPVVPKYVEGSVPRN